MANKKVVKPIVEDLLEQIRLKDEDFYNTICEVIEHLANTYSDKYVVENPMVDTKNIIYNDSAESVGYNIGNATKYIQRYLTNGFDKSKLPSDLKKSIHYLLFELTRRSKFPE